MTSGAIWLKVAAGSFDTWCNLGVQVLVGRKVELEQVMVVKWTSTGLNAQRLKVKIHMAFVQQRSTNAWCLEKYFGSQQIHHHNLTGR